jgi:hypothetical protein
MLPITKSQIKKHLHRIVIPAVESQDSTVHDELPNVPRKEDIWSFIFQEQLKDMKAYLKRNGL